MEAQAGAAIVVQHACRALTNLSVSLAGQQAVVGAAAPVAIVTALRAHGRDSAVARDGCWALDNLAHPRLPAGQEAVVRAGAAVVAVDVLRGHMHDLKVAQAACDALANISFSPAGQAAVTAAGGRAVVSDSMARHPGAAPLQRSGRQVLERVLS
jgi:hypothetical protein